MKISDNDIKKLAVTVKDRLEKAIIMRMQMIGERFISNGRIRGNYTDRTGNLRSSIGYVILKNGLQMDGSDWILIRPGAHEGIKAGQELLAEMARRFPTGLVLILVAGMKYAAAVESKGFEVITNSATEADQEFKKAIERIIKKVSSSNL